MTIRERGWQEAVKYHQGDSVYANGYIDGAIEQEQITKQEMINKACELLCKTCNIGLCGEDQKCHRYKGFKKAMEE